MSASLRLRRLANQLRASASAGGDQNRDDVAELLSSVASRITGANDNVISDLVGVLEYLVPDSDSAPDDGLREADDVPDYLAADYEDSIERNGEGSPVKFMGHDLPSGVLDVVPYPALEHWYCLHTGAFRVVTLVDDCQRIIGERHTLDEDVYFRADPEGADKFFEAALVRLMTDKELKKFWRWFSVASSNPNPVPWPLTLGIEGWLQRILERAYLVKERYIYLQEFTNSCREFVRAGDKVLGSKDDRLENEQWVYHIQEALSITRNGTTQFDQFFPLTDKQSRWLYHFALPLFGEFDKYLPLVCIAGKKTIKLSNQQMQRLTYTVSKGRAAFDKETFRRKRVNIFPKRKPPQK